MDFFLDLLFDFLFDLDLLVFDISELSDKFKSLVTLLKIPPTILDFLFKLGFLSVITELIPSSLSESYLLEIYNVFECGYLDLNFLDRFLDNLDFVELRFLRLILCL